MNFLKIYFAYLCQLDNKLKCVSNLFGASYIMQDRTIGVLISKLHVLIEDAVVYSYNYAERTLFFMPLLG